MNYNLDRLEAFLRENEIPRIKKKPLTFLEISKQPHYENVISNIYAFFFEVNQEHGLNDLFIHCLIELIHEKTEGNKKEFSDFKDFKIDTEYGTDENGRIDILLSNDDYAIIIENKIYHHLNNNLADYWDSINVSNKKIGIVLSLGIVNNIDYKKFINITHKELLGRVFKKLGDYMLDANEKYLVFIKDFYQNIMNMSGSKTEEKDFLFYYQNLQEINQLIKLKEELVFKHISEESYRSLVGNDNLEFKRPRKTSSVNQLKYFVSKKHNDVRFSIKFDELITEKGKLYIRIELQGKAKQLLIQESECNKITVSEKSKKLINNNLKSEHRWMHFASEGYKLKEDKIYTLSTTIYNIVEESGFNELFKGIEKYLSEVRKQ